MKFEVSHSFKEETLEAKIKWFLQKPIEERLKEALAGVSFVRKLQQIELPDDRSTFKSFRILEPKRG